MTESSFIARAERWKKGISGAFGLLCLTVPANADYRLHEGDVIEIVVAGIPELHQRVTIQLDGSISFPLLGAFKVAGLGPAEVRSRIQTALGSKIFRQRTADGRENAIVIEPDQVTATVVQYQPIYVTGDVSRPGEQSYRPLMTVRHAVALSGGYDTLRSRSNNPVFESADLRSEYASLWTESAKEHMRVWRLQSELGQAPGPGQEELKGAPLPASTIAQIARLEDEQLKTRRADHEQEKAFLQRSAKQADEQIAVLVEQLAQEEQGVHADAQELRRVTELFGKGALTSPRLTETRRAVLLSSTRKLQTAVHLMQVRRQRGDLFRQIEKMDDQRRLNLLRELQDTSVKLVGIRARLQGVVEKLGYVPSMLNDSRQFFVIRNQNEKRDRFEVEQDAEIKPGDVVEVNMRREHILAKSAE